MTPGKHYNQYFYANVVRLMKVKKLSNQDMARAVGYTDKAFINVLNGERRLTDEWLELIARALGVPSDALFEVRTCVDNSIESIAMDVSAEDVTPEDQERYANELYGAIPKNHTKRLLKRENSKLAVGEFIIQHPRMCTIIAVLLVVSMATYLFYPEPYTRIYSGIIMCGMGILLSPIWKRKSWLSVAMDILLWGILILLVILFLIFGILGIVNK